MADLATAIHMALAGQPVTRDKRITEISVDVGKGM